MTPSYLSRTFLLIGLGLSSLTGIAATTSPAKPALAVSRSSATKAEPKSQIPRIAFEKYTLPNGLQVILHVDRKIPVVHVNQWFHVGSKNEKPGRTGFAHLFEHLMFQGSQNVGDYITQIEKLGSRELNGTTNVDRTNYFASVPSGSLEYLLWVESDRLATLADAMTQEKLDNQREVVKNERRQNYENRPYGKAPMIVAESLYPKGHPYSWTTIGDPADLNAATLDDVKDFFRTYYTPNNLTLTITGDFDPATAKRLVEKYFGPIPPGPALERPKRWVPQLSGEKVVDAKDRVPQEMLMMVWPSPPLFDKGDAALDLTSLLLTDGLSSRLQKALVYDRQLATAVNAYQSSKEISGDYNIVALARPGASLDEIQAIIDREIARLAKDGPTEAELQREKAKQEYGFVSALESIGGKADMLGMYNTYFGDPGLFDEDMARYRAVTPADIRRTVDQWLNNKNRLIVRYHPMTAAQPAATELDRSKVPALQADRSFEAPKVETAKLANGMEIYVVNRPELPKVAVSIISRAGGSQDPEGKTGVANLMAGTMTLGTATRNAFQIEDALGDLGAEMSGSAGRESSRLNFQTLKRNLGPVMEIAADVERRPAFPESEVAREKKRLMDALAQEASNPSALAGRIAPMVAFGANHPYGEPLSGLPSTVPAITRSDLAQFHQKYITPGNTAIIFTGDVTLDEAKALTQKAFGDWSGAAPALTPIPAPQPMGPGKVFLVDKPGAAQTVIYQMLPAPPRDSDDYYNLLLANAVWGGSFGSRLNLNLREDKGYSYGIGSYPDLAKAAGAWIATGGVQTDKTQESVAEFMKELKGIAGEKPITAKELDDAKEMRIRSYAQKFETLGDISGQVSNLYVLGLPMSELQREPEETRRATVAEVNAVAQKYARPGEMSLLLVGDRAKIEPGLRALNVGPLVILNEEGKVVSP